MSGSKKDLLFHCRMDKQTSNILELVKLKFNIDKSSATRKAIRVYWIKKLREEKLKGGYENNVTQTNPSS